VIGGLFGYAIGYFCLPASANSFCELLHLAQSFPKAACYLRAHGWEIIVDQGCLADPLQADSTITCRLHRHAAA